LPSFFLPAVPLWSFLVLDFYHSSPCLKQKFWTRVCQLLGGCWSMDRFQGSISHRDIVARNHKTQCSGAI
jgi:hypothetical protein